MPRLSVPVGAPALLLFAAANLGWRPWAHAARVLTVIYFIFFLAMPWYTSHDNERPEPARVVW